MSRPVVYFAERDGLIKIGTTIALRSRLNALGARPLAAVEGSYAEERKLHQRFASDRIAGEWFHPSAALMGFIAGLPALPSVAPSELLTSRQVAEMIAVSPATVARWARDHNVVSLRTPAGRLRFRREDVERALRPTPDTSDSTRTAGAA
jgi:excisionase family DNA binding protein